MATAERRPWSRLEDEATVADYLDMLRAEVSGKQFNKSEHRRRLAKLLDSRTDAAIEKKHQNISAVLIERGLYCIEGYKPLGNYQRSLADVVDERVAADAALHTLLESAVRAPAPVPDIDDILNRLVKPPTPPRPLEYSRKRAVAEPPLGPTYEYQAMEARNRSLGFAGEQFALRFEQARLIASGHERLAASVEHVAATRGDGLGYDILSFDDDGRERLVEVKTTGYGPSTPFFVSANEVEVSNRESARYNVYRVFDFRRDVRLFQVPGRIGESFQLDPTQFRARLRAP